MRSMAIINQKGGSGKTTTSVNLAAALGEQGRRVLVVDLDPQASATHWYDVEDPGRGISNIFISQTPLLELVRATAVLGVAVVPSSAWLSGAEKSLLWENASLQVFRKSLATLPREQWDYVIVDCPPTLGLLTANALIGAKEVLIPVEAHHMALPGVDRVIASVDTLRTHLNPDLNITIILPCRVDARTRHSREVVRELRSRFGNLVSKVEIRENIRLAEAPARQQPITIYDSHSKGAEDYRQLALEVIANENGRG